MSNSHEKKTHHKESAKSTPTGEKAAPGHQDEASYSAMADILGLEKEELFPKHETPDELNNQINELEKKVDEQKDKLMRAMAELENTRRIASRDITNARKFALEKFANDLLPVIDSSEQGLEASLNDKASIKTIHDGMALTQKMFVDILEKYGIEAIKPVGEMFNSEFHEAIGMEVSQTHKPNSIIKVVQKGYLLNQRVIRPARVIVAKAPQE